MIFNKSDKSFERAGLDKSERSTLIKKLKRRRAIGFWGGVLGIFGVLILGLALAGTAVTSLKTFDSIATAMKILAPSAIGLFCGSVLVDQQIKMLLLVGAENSPTEDAPVGQAETGKPDPACS